MTDEDHDITAALAAAPEATGTGWERARAALAARAAADGLVDVAVERHDTPLGTVVLGATDRGVVRVGLPAEDAEAVLDELALKVSPRVLIAPRETLTSAHHQLDEYFAHRRVRFDLPLDWRLTVGFRRAVLEATAAIPFGATRSYREVATAAGSPNAVRAAGTALATSRFPILVPCHRVLRTGGALGAYRGGAAAKALLLELEGAA